MGRAAGFFAVVVFVSCWTISETLAGPPEPASAGARRQGAVLDQLLRLLPPDRTANGPVSFQDATFPDWLARTGELPPDFDQMPSLPFLPDPLRESNTLSDLILMATPVRNNTPPRMNRISYSHSIEYPPETVPK